jgi:hypothetical protein
MPNELVRYRRAGGMAGLDQRLTVFEDGRVVLDDRKGRSRVEVEATAEETERLRALLAEVPDSEWHGWGGAALRRSMPRAHDAIRFEVRCGSRRISGNAGRHDADLAAIISELDQLVARAVRERRG